MVATAGTLEIQLIADLARLRKDMNDMQRIVGSANDNIERSANRAGGAFNKVTQSAGSTRAGMQQLSYQLGDVATMFSMGAKPAQIFASQLGQTVQAVQLMTGGTSRLAAFLGGPWGMAISVAAIALVPFISKLFETESAANSARGALEELSKRRQKDLAEKNIIANSEKGLNELIQKRAQLEAYIARQPRNRATGEAMFSFKQMKELREVNAQIAEGRAAIIDQVNREAKPTADTVNKLIEKSNKAASAVGGAARAAGGHAKVLSEQEQALKQATAESTRYAEGLEEQVSKLGKTALEIHRMEVAAKAAAAPTAELARRIREAGAAIEADMIQRATDEYKKMIQSLNDEYQLLGLVGPAREEAALALEETAFKAKAAADGVQDVAAAWEEYRAAKMRNINRSAEIDAEREATHRLNDEIRDTIGLLQQIGGFGGVLGDALGFVSGNFGSMNSALGQILNSSYTKKDGTVVKLGSELREIFGLNGKFGQTMTAVLQQAGIGAAIGDMSDKLMKGLGIKSSNTGAQIGGAAGMAAFGPIGAVAGSIIGGIVGGLFKSTKWGRAIVNGSGNVAVDGNSGKFKSAAEDAGSAVVDALKNIADALGGTLTEFEGIAIGVRDGKWRVNVNGTSLKTSKGAVNFGKDGAEEAIAYAVQQAIKIGAIDGLRAGTLALLKGGKDFEAQLKKAIDFENVFKSLEASTNPLKAALDGIRAEFEYLSEVFKEAGATAAEYAQLQEYIAKQQAAAIDSASATYRANFYTSAENEAYAKNQIKTQMTALGYPDVDTVAEYKKLVDSIDTSTEEGMTKYGALLELADEFATLQQAQEERAAAAAQKAAEAQALAVQKAQMEVELLRLQGKEAEALKKERELALSQLDASLRALQQQIFRAQDIADAKDVLREAYDRESAALEQTIDKFKAFGTTLREFRDSLYSSDDATSSYTARLAKLMQVGGLASTGDETALGQLPGVGKDFLDAARNRAGSAQDYARQVALVARYTDQAIAASDSQVSVAEQQLAAMKSQVGALIDLTEGLVSVETAIERLNSILSPGNGPAPTGGSGAPRFNYGNFDLGTLFARLQGGQPLFDFSMLSDKLGGLQTEMEQTNRNTALLTNIWNRVTRDGTSLAIVTDSDTPINVVTP